MSLKQERFVAAYLKNGGQAKAAAIEAGYSQKCAAVLGARLINHNEDVKRAVSIVRKEIQEAAKYDTKAALEEADRLMNEARTEKQYSAVASIYQTKNKIAGNIIDKHDIRAAVSFQINITGIDDPRPVEEISAKADGKNDGK